MLVFLVNIISGIPYQIVLGLITVLSIIFFYPISEPLELYFLKKKKKKKTYKYRYKKKISLLLA